jgi:hypothetical protein
MTRWLRHPAVWLPISMGLLGLVAWRSRVWEIGSRLGTVDFGPLVVALLLNVAIAAAWAVRSADLLGAAGRRVPVLRLVPMTVFANLVNNLTPGSVGELVRLYLLRAHHGVDYTVGGAVILIERVVAIAYLAASSLLFWVAVQAGLAWPVVIAATILIALAPAIAYGVGIRPAAVLRALPLGAVLGDARWQSTQQVLARLDETIASLLREPWRAVSFAALSAVVFAAYAFQLVLVGRALGVTIDPVAAWGALGIGVTVGVISLLPFGLGSTDLTVAALLGLVGVPAVEAAGIVFGYRVVSTLPMGLAGVVSYATLSAGLPASGARGAIRSAGEALADAPTDGQ